MEPAEPKPLPDDIPFERWVAYVFDHPILDPQWYFRALDPEHYEDWDERAVPARTLEYMTRLFRDPEFLIGRYSLPQIDQGLWFLFDSSASGHMNVLSETALPWPSRRACFDAMIALYQRLLAPLYGDTLGHAATEKGAFACYMLWDVIPLYVGMEHEDRDRINDAVLNVFETVLKTMTAEACLESVLHGLGEWHCSIADRTEPIVRRFLQRTEISPELRRYAEAAATGMVQ